jgi:hypothetical protein
VTRAPNFEAVKEATAARANERFRWFVYRDIDDTGTCVRARFTFPDDRYIEAYQWCPDEFHRDLMEHCLDDLLRELCADVGAACVLGKWP